MAQTEELVETAKPNPLIGFIDTLFDPVLGLLDDVAGVGQSGGFRSHVGALRRGAVPEVVLHGRTGFVCNDESELPDALHQVTGLDPEDCAEHVRTMFSVPLMARRYERVYRHILAARGRGTAALVHDPFATESFAAAGARAARQ